MAAVEAEASGDLSAPSIATRVAPPADGSSTHGQPAAEAAPLVKQDPDAAAQQAEPAAALEPVASTEAPAGGAAAAVAAGVAAGGSGASQQQQQGDVVMAEAEEEDAEEEEDYLGVLRLLGRGPADAPRWQARLQLRLDGSGAPAPDGACTQLGFPTATLLGAPLGGASCARLFAGQCHPPGPSRHSSAPKLLSPLPASAPHLLSPLPSSLLKFQRRRWRSIWRRRGRRRRAARRRMRAAAPTTSPPGCWREVRAGLRRLLSFACTLRWLCASIAASPGMSVLRTCQANPAPSCAPSTPTPCRRAAVGGAGRAANLGRPARLPSAVAGGRAGAQADAQAGQGAGLCRQCCRQLCRMLWH